MSRISDLSERYLSESKDASKEKLDNLSNYNERFKMVYELVKQNKIDQKRFNDLINYIITLWVNGKK